MADITVVGGGVAGLSAACALAEAGLRVQLVERRPYLGGRASSFRHPGVGEVIDNCQHVVFGCCTHMRAFYRRIGVERLIRWSDAMTFVEPGGRQSVLGPAPLPAPLQGLPGLWAARAFDRRDKLALARAFAALLRPVPAESTETLADWLGRHGQTRGAIERFWKLVIASALNADLGTISLPYASMVIRELFLNSREGGRMGVSTVPLGELYAAAGRFLEARGGAIRLDCAVTGAQWDEGRRKWRADAGAGEAIESDALILALPFEALGKLLPGLPPAPAVQRLADQAARHEHWPILSVHLWFDRPFTALDHAVLLDGDFHWLYNKSRIQPGREGSPAYVELVVSAARELAAVPGPELIARAQASLPRYFPEAGRAALVKAAVVKEQRATFAVPPGVDAYRPEARSPWPRCYLAGDWTRTGWPSTMESAARSGHAAAAAAARDAGAAPPAEVRDLRPSLIARVLSGWPQSGVKIASVPREEAGR